MSTWVESLKREYADGKRQLEAYRKTLDPENPDDQFESKTVGGMISDLQFALEWMRTGRRPGSRRGVESRDAYPYSALMDMELFPSWDLDLDPEPEPDLTSERKRLLVKILLKMSTRERQCYLLHMAQGMSLAEIAKELKISKGVAHTYIKRARAKVEQGIKG